MREIPQAGDEVAKKTRITPACAGNTFIWGETMSGKRDHPRMCGKYGTSPAFFLRVLGSPPHVREILSLYFFRRFVSGITPACAGNTFCLSTFQKLKAGSPPHVREIPYILLTCQKLVGITPACAGNTFFSPVISAFVKDHPRMCGKYELREEKLSLNPGSPPHVREIHTKRSIYDATCNLRIPFFHSLLNFQFIS